MKRHDLKLMAPSLLLVATLGAGGIAHAHEGEPHEAPVGTDAEQPIPASVEGLWHAIDTKTAELQKTIQAGSLDEVHHLAFAVRDLVAALPLRSGKLPADKLARIKGNVKFVATLADRLDAAGDAKDKAGAQANYDKLMKVVGALRADMPPTSKP